MDQEWSGIGQDTHTMKGHSLSLVGRGFFSFVSVFFNFVLSKREISVMSGLSDILPVKDKKRKAPEATALTFSVSHISWIMQHYISHLIRDFLPHISNSRHDITKAVKMALSDI